MHCTGRRRRGTAPVLPQINFLANPLLGSRTGAETGATGLFAEIREIPTQINLPVIAAA
jgi:hypothetical protein